MKAYVLILLSALVACGGGTDPMKRPDVDATAQMPDGLGASRIPAWMLEDVQPTSPRAGQTYGLDTFSGKIVVVVLLEGF